MESKKINQLATELAPDLSDLTIIGDPSTGISKKITLSQMASLFTGTVEEYANFAAFPLVGVADTIYIALDTNVLYRWNTGTSAYVELSPNIINSLVFGDGSGFDGTISLVGSVATLTITTALTTGSVGFIGASGALLEDNANFFWNNSTKRLGINTNAPITALDVFGSGIIGRINGTTTNNAFLGFASAGTNRWSIGNVQANNRFRIYNEATTSELISVLSTGEFGIGIANPTTKFHIDGAASALIANLDADVSIAKSISFRSDNSNRINLEVSGTESGSNAGANFFIRRYSDAGSLIDTPFSILRSLGFVGIGTNNPTRQFEIYNITDAIMRFNGARVGNSVMSVGTESAGFVVYDDTNSAYRLIISQTGDFGIGMTPTKKFQVNTGTNAVLSVQYDTTDRVELGAFSSANGYRSISITGSTISFGTNTAGGSSVIQRMTISPLGNVGIGGTVGSGKLYIKQSANTFADGINSYYSGNDNFVGIAHNGGVGFLSSSYNTTGSYTPLGFVTSDIERMRIASGGNVLIGTTTDNAGKLQVNGEIRMYGSTLFRGMSSNTLQLCGGTSSSNILIDGSVENITISTNGADRVKINENGQVLMNTASALTSGLLCIAVPSNNFNAIVLKDTGTTYTSANYYQVFTNSSNTIAGSISHNTATTIGFNTSSDYRLKEDFKDFNGLDILSNIKFYDFKWKEEELRMHGVIAHELEPLLPLAVSGYKDAVDKEGNIISQGVDYSKIVPILGKAIQELKAEIEELKALINK
jgi:hypothetical protein